MTSKTPETSSDDDRHYVRRLAARLAQIAERNPGLTMSVMRCRLAGTERHLFPAACAVALDEGWIVRDGTVLHRGQRSMPDVPKSSAAALADQVDAELVRLANRPDRSGDDLRAAGRSSAARDWS